MVDRDELGDHPTHRRVHDMGSLDIEFVKQADDIVGHVMQRIWDYRPDGGQITVRSRRDDGSEVHGMVVELGRQAAVAVVESDDEPALVDEESAEPVVPGQQLGAEAGDQHDRRIVGRPDRVVLELDACLNEHLCHRFSVGLPAIEHEPDSAHAHCGWSPVDQAHPRRWADR
jgi:hypothetical protein